MDNKPNNIEILSRCSVCRNKFRHDDLTLVSEKNLKTIFHATCSRCQASSLILLFSGAKGLMGMGMLTDLDKDEVKEKINTEAITTDEVIDAYKILNS